MVLDVCLIVIFIIAVLSGRKSGLFRTVARFLSLGLAAVCTSLFGETLRTWLSGFSIYNTAIEKLTAFVENAVAAGKTSLVEPFLQEADMAIDLAAQGILDTLLTGITFAVFSVLLRILIELLDKFLFHLPLVRPVNRILGMVLSFLFTAVVSYLVIGVLGGFAMCSESAFISDQMQNSVLVRGMYENNIVLQLFLRKG